MIKSDYWGVDASELKRMKLFLFDMDGTIYNENDLIDGTLLLLKYIVDSGGKFVFVTNNSSKSVVSYIDKLRYMGIIATRDNIFTSTLATIMYVRQTYAINKLYCMGTALFQEELLEAGFEVTTSVDPSAEAIVVGFDTELTSQKLRNTCEMLQYDIPFIATHPDLTCPVSFGFIPDCGAVCQMLTHATGRVPLYIGKPSKMMITYPMELYGYTKDETVVIGDRLYTDIAAGLNANVATVCVLTGEATPKDIETTEFRPRYTFGSVLDIYHYLASD